MQAMGIVKEQMKCFWSPSLLQYVFNDVLSLKSLHEDDVTPAQAEQITSRTAQKSKRKI